MNLKIKKGDSVFVITGADRNLEKPRRVLAVYPKTMRILVEGVNVQAKHSRPSQQNQKGGIVHKEMPVHYSNVMISDSDSKPTRIGNKLKADTPKGTERRFARTNEKAI
ncbi:MAG: 50S ribosomal protein L24 [Candidatus Kapabacteria bacterium]|nr:50S ribosomal protein L24 [Candidatus Kapabacteria bacterium]